MKRFIIIILFLFSFVLNAQEYKYFSMSLSQDIKLLTSDDDYGNEAPTLDLCLNLSYIDENSGVYIEFEHANLRTYYNRASIGFIYLINLNNYYIRTNITPYSFIIHNGKTYPFSIGIDFIFMRKLSNDFYVGLKLQNVSRTDIDRYRNSLMINLTKKL